MLRHSVPGTPVTQLEDKTVMTTAVQPMPGYDTNYGITQPASPVYYESSKANPNGPPTYVTTAATSPTQEQPSYIVQQQQQPPQQQLQPQQPQVQYVPVPMFQPQQQSMGVHTMHLGTLQSAAATVECPRCKTRSLTRIEFRAGNTTHAWAAVFFFISGLPCIPYLMAGLKDVQHTCAHCGTLLATWHKSGRTEVHAYA